MVRALVFHAADHDSISRIPYGLLNPPEMISNHRTKSELLSIAGAIKQSKQKD